MKKKLKRWGNNLVIVFTHEDEEVYNLIDGNVLNFTITNNGGKNEKQTKG